MLGGCMEIKITSGKDNVVDPCFVKYNKKMGEVINISNGDYTLSSGKARLMLGISEETYIKDVTMLKKLLNLWEIQKAILISF